MQWHFRPVRQRAHGARRGKRSLPAVGPILILVLTPVIAGCASGNEYIYKLYGGAPRPDAEVATIRLPTQPLHGLMTATSATRTTAT